MDGGDEPQAVRSTDHWHAIASGLVCASSALTGGPWGVSQSADFFFAEIALPSVVRRSASVCFTDIQVFIATHSLFLMRELEMLLQDAPFQSLAPRYFALKASGLGKPTELEQSADLYDIKTLVLLDEELHQSDRFMAVEGLHARD